ncbi:sensor histidine kinase [Aliarcobacter vitoriensis]|uniref:histidine kinase n=1 Tax=Aliarcobacter vitoriensis TaxID=2011099 RepID=A0A366MUC4_9BACT|nr:sensor histidine kinase [Aliarcobacter vitoriensis]RBQ29868.1 histidine kinase [Aliarcobacter vitoriensis]
MKKIILTLFLLFINLYGHHHGSFIRDYVSENHVDFKDLQYSEYRNVVLDEFTIKFKLDLEQLGDETYYLTVISDKNSLVYTNVKYEIINSIIVVKLDKYQKEEIFFKYRYAEPKIADFRSDCISIFEYKYLLQYEGVLYGTAYGIIFCAFLYYLIIYFSTKMRCFLYYSLMQFFLLLSLVGFMYFSYKSSAPIFMYTLVDFAETLAFLFTFLFAQAILETKNKLPFFHKILNIFIVLNFLDLIAILISKYSILYEYMPFYIGVLIPCLIGLIAIFKGDKNAIVYTIGWFVMCVIIYISQKGLFTISGIYIIHIGTPLESLIFSFALGIMLRNLAKEKNEKEKLLIHQSKLASMGEMINNIAHQWRQPLTHLGFINMNLQLVLEDEIIDRKYIKDKLKESSYQLDFMSQTIDNFRDFYKLNKQKEFFYVSVAVQKAIDIMKVILENKKIVLDFEIRNDKELNAYENEYSQVVLNLLTNAKDVLIERNIENPNIKLIVDVKDNISIVSVIDNGGGIEKDKKDLIFDPYFTTKQKGSGIGLYMSKMIIEQHFKGKLIVYNIEDGAKFEILV